MFTELVSWRRCRCWCWGRGSREGGEFSTAPGDIPPTPQPRIRRGCARCHKQHKHITAVPMTPTSHRITPLAASSRHPSQSTPLAGRSSLRSAHIPAASDRRKPAGRDTPRPATPAHACRGGVPRARVSADLPGPAAAHGSATLRTRLSPRRGQRLMMLAGARLVDGDRCPIKRLRRPGEDRRHLALSLPDLPLKSDGVTLFWSGIIASSEAALRLVRGDHLLGAGGPHLRPTSTKGRADPQLRSVLRSRLLYSQGRRRRFPGRPVLISGPRSGETPPARCQSA